MIVAVVLALLALFDVTLGGFRAIAGRDGRIAKGAWFRAGLGRAAAHGLGLIAINAAIAALLCATAPAPATTWAELVRVGAVAVWGFGAFATVTAASLGLWFSPSPEYRVLATVIVLGPLTLLRPLVIVGGLGFAASGSSEPRVWIAATVAGATMLALEPLLGRRHRHDWRRLVD